MGLTDAGVVEDRGEGPTDQPPTIIDTPSPSFTEGTAAAYDMTQHVSDDGLSAVTYTLSNPLPNGLSFIESTGILDYDGIGIPTVSQHALTATDAVGSATSSSFDLVVAGVSINTIPDQVLGVGGQSSLAGYVVDTYGVAISSQLLNADANISYSHTGYTITAISPTTLTNVQLEITY